MVSTMGKGGQVPQRASDFQSELASSRAVAAKVGRAAPPAARDPLLAAVPREVYMDAASNVPSASYYKDLNDKVADIIERQRTGAKTAPPVELSHVVAADGALVYPNRYLWMVWVYSAVAIYLICQAPSPAAVLLGVSAMYLCYDVYSGVTHVNDDQRNLAGLKSYILFQGCLEFQWHHAIPVDITKKSFVACCADLNIVVAVSVVINCVALGYSPPPHSRASSSSAPTLASTATAPPTRPRASAPASPSTSWTRASCAPRTSISATTSRRTTRTFASSATATASSTACSDTAAPTTGSGSASGSPSPSATSTS